MDNCTCGHLYHKGRCKAGVRPSGKPMPEDGRDVTLVQCPCPSFVAAEPPTAHVYYSAKEQAAMLRKGQPPVASWTDLNDPEALPLVECDWQPVITGPDEDGEREFELRLSPTKQLLVRVTPDGLLGPIVRHDDTGTYEHFVVLPADVVAHYEEGARLLNTIGADSMDNNWWGEYETWLAQDAALLPKEENDG